MQKCQKQKQKKKGEHILPGNSRQSVADLNVQHDKLIQPRRR